MKTRAAGTARDAAAETVRDAETVPSDSLLLQRRQPRIETIEDVDDLALFDPDEYERLLRSYWLLLGESRLWWELRSTEDPARWQKAVAEAIVVVANAGTVPPDWLADALDGELPKTRRRVIAIARQRYSEPI